MVTKRTDEPDAKPGRRADDEEDLDVEMALLAMNEDLGGPREELDLSALSPEEKRTLLKYLRERLGVTPRDGD
jgi:hypothetical protein